MTGYGQFCAIARAHDAALAHRVRYAQGDAFALEFPDAHFDLVVCRHLSQCVPHFERVLEAAEMIVAKEAAMAKLYASEMLARVTDQAIQIGELSRQRVIERFTIAGATEHYAETYARLLKLPQ